MLTDQIGYEMHRLITEWSPVCHCLTGNGFRETLEVLSRHVPLETHELPRGNRGL